MKKISLVLCLASLCMVAIFLGACSNGTEKTAVVPFSLDSAKAAIAASNKLYGECFAKGDSTAFVSCYTSDGCIYTSNMPKLCGPQAIAAFFNGGYAQGIRNIKLFTEEVMGGKEAVIETGKYELLADKDVSIEKGKYIIIWKEEGGKWKMHRDIFNSDMPPPPPVK